MVQTNQQVYENLMAFLSEEEFVAIEPKIKYYLHHYVKEYSIINFKVSILPSSTVDRIIFYTKEDNSQFRQIKFNPDGDVLSVMHFEKNKEVAKGVYGLPRKSIIKINNAK